MIESITVDEAGELYPPNMKDLLHVINDLVLKAYQRGLNGEPMLGSLKERTAAASPDASFAIAVAAIVDGMAADAWERGRSGEKPDLIFSV